jgi:hypothetical protein
VCSVVGKGLMGGVVGLVQAVNQTRSRDVQDSALVEWQDRVWYMKRNGFGNS